jgi:hypothetical protein
LVFVFSTSVNFKCCILPTTDTAVCCLQYRFWTRMNEGKYGRVSFCSSSWCCEEISQPFFGRAVTALIHRDVSRQSLAEFEHLASIGDSRNESHWHRRGHTSPPCNTCASCDRKGWRAGDSRHEFPAFIRKIQNGKSC